MVTIRRVSSVRAYIRETTRTSGKVERYVARKAFRTAKFSKTRLNRSPRRIDTGLLRSSILPVPHPVIQGAWRVGTDVPYARYVLFGTYKMEANPYLIDGLNQAFKVSG